MLGQMMFLMTTSTGRTKELRLEALSSDYSLPGCQCRYRNKSSWSTAHNYGGKKGQSSFSGAKQLPGRRSDKAHSNPQLGCRIELEVLVGRLFSGVLTCVVLPNL